MSLSGNVAFFRNHNGISVFHDRFWVSNEDVQLFTDRAGGPGMGFGIYFQGHWYNAKWSESWRRRRRGVTLVKTVLELFPIVVALFIAQPKLRKVKIQR